MTKLKRLPIWITVISILWILFVIFFYFVDIKKTVSPVYGQNKVSFELEWRPSHLYYIKALEKLVEVPKNDLKNIKLNPLVSIFLVVLCVYFGLLLISKSLKRGELVLKITPALWVLISFVFAMVLFVFWDSYFGINEPILYSNAATKIGLAFLEILLISFPVIALGKSIKDRLLPKTNDLLSEFLFSVGFGIGFTILLLFILAALSILTRYYLAGLFVVFYAINYRNVYFWLKTFFTRKLEIKLSGSLVFFGLIFIVLAIFAQNILEVTRPMPVGHDELERYMNTTSLIAQNGRLLRTSEMPYPWELFRTIPWILFNNPVATNIFSSLAGLLAFLGLFKLVQNYCAQRLIAIKNSIFYPLLVATIFYALPMVVFQSAVDLKTDLFAFFVGTLSLILFFEWRKGLNHKNLLLYLAFYFAGLAFVIKLTSIFFVIGLIAMVLATLISRRYRLVMVLKIFAVGVVFFLISLAPFGINNIVQNRSIAPDKILYSHSFSTGIYVDPNSEGYRLLQDKAIANGQAELNRYFGFRKSEIANILTLPFTEAFNSAVRGQYVDTGFVYLAIIPLVIIMLTVLIRRKEKPDKNFLLIVVGAVFTWAIWVFYAKGIIWYGILGFAFFSLILVEILHFFSKFSKVISLVIYLAIVAWLLSALVLRTTVLPDLIHTLERTQMEYIRGSIGDDQIKQSYFSGYRDIQDLNLRIAKSGDLAHSKVYVVGKYYRYFIKDNDQLASEDQFVIFGEIFLPGRNVDATIAKFKENGFKYIVVSNVTGPIYGNELLTEVNVLGKEFIKGNPDKIKILNADSGSGVIVAEFL